MGQVFYTTGEEVRLGDVVEMDGQMGTIVACPESGLFSPEFPESDWYFLKEGVLWDGEIFGVIHIAPLPDPDLVLIRRKHNSD